ncbi:alpha/beta hydrolase [Ponticaulis sp.]|uniref:alpha/beta fold hydrolase n=1 Tax=Ponticaulis sp. TaxID=2020902 RepID=UPI000C362377|nr:alpha/beta hydrolase [Ponticaulis sp.]MAF57625.1 hypothetical protein [Ponticaulis sp.]MBN02675.1 hypothetical protein [Ponticaulis sp.]
MNIKRSTASVAGICGALFALAACETTPPAAPLTLSAAACTPPPVDRCVRGEDCGALVIEQGPAVNAETGRNYYLDYSCDLREGEPVTVVLNLHGGGSYGNWQRHYFPIADYVDEYNLVVATPNAPPQRWAEVDDEHLQGIVTNLIDEIGAENIDAFWLAGHSQGGMTSRRIVCTPFFEDKVDGLLSLSGGRISRAQISPNFYRPSRGETGPRPPREYPPEVLPQCEFSHIYTTGELEIVELPDTSSWADQLGCDARVREEDVVDTLGGYVFDSQAQANPNPVWGLMPGPGTAEVFNYPNCDDGRVVADVIRLDKGHTEGLEPEVTQALIELMLSASGGKIAASEG